MRIKALGAVAGALALTLSPALARDSQPDRASPPVQSSSEMFGNGSSLPTILAIVAVALAIFLAADSGGAPDSP